MRRGSKVNRMLDRYCGIPLVASFGLLHRKRKMPKTIERIGIISSPALGDTLVLSAAIADLRSQFPTQKLVFFCTPQNAVAADLLPGVDKKIHYSLLRPMAAVKSMRDERLDLLVDFSGWQRLTALYSTLSGAKFKAGFFSRNQYRHYGYDLTADHSSKVHELENFRNLVRAMGIPAQHPPTLSVPTVSLPTEFAKRNLIILHLWPSGVRSSLREWPQERWLELAAELKYVIPDPHFVITGSPADRERSIGFVEKLEASGCQGHAFTGSDGLATLCQILLASRLVVSTNTGVMHLAAILGAPTVSINGPTNNQRWGPIGANAVGVNSPGKGCGFLDLGFEWDGNPTDCMRRISVQQVLAAIEQVVKVSGAPVHVSAAVR